jgi:hypothetical protein
LIFASVSLTTDVHCVLSKALLLQFHTHVLRAPQQMLRPHRSLEDLLCKAKRKMMMMIFFCFSILMENRCNEIDRENRSTRRKTCPSVALSTTNPTWTDLGNPTFSIHLSLGLFFSLLPHGLPSSNPLPCFGRPFLQHAKLFQSTHFNYNYIHNNWRFSVSGTHLNAKCIFWCAEFSG